jgi:hypothetical protein
LLLPGSSFEGPIPKYLGDVLFELRSLDLSFNALTGAMPSFGQRFENYLVALRLHDNRISKSDLSEDYTFLKATTSKKASLPRRFVSV